jgi:hypothetical protein
VKLGELIEALEDYKLHTMGVDEDTDVLITVPSAQIEGQVDDVKVIVTRSRNQYSGRHTEATVVIEVAEV